MIIAREHRGGLEESLKTAKTFSTKEEMIKYYYNLWSKVYGKNTTITVSDSTYKDSRINWLHTHYILCNDGVVGMCDLEYNS